MKNRILLLLAILVLIPISYANAQTGDLELTLENIEIAPIEPKEGDLITITTEVHNTGKTNTGSVASIVTIAFFIDEQLIDVKDLGDVKTGVRNKVKITSEPVRIVNPGEHTVKAIVNYHKTIGEQLDLPDGNSIEKIFKIRQVDPTNIFLTIEPKYGFQNNEETIKIAATLTDTVTNNPLTGKKIILDIEGEKIDLVTNDKGKVSFQKTNNFLKAKNIEVSFEGDNDYGASNASSILHALPNKIKSALIVELQDENEQFHLEEYPLKIIIFQESYENIVKEIMLDSTTLLNSKTFFVDLPPKSDYFAELYWDGEFFAEIQKENLEENNYIFKKIKIPESASIRFNVFSEEGSSIKEGIVKIGTQSEQIKDGITGWINIIPITGKQYNADIVRTDGISVKSESFSVFPGEKKTVTIQIKEPVKIILPDWIKNNAAWWADGSIDDETFVQGIQFMVKQGIIKIPATTQNSDLSSDRIPDWIKNNAAWWADGSIDDETFVQGIQFMVKQGIIRV